MKIFLLIGICFCLFLIGFYMGRGDSLLGNFGGKNVKGTSVVSVDSGSVAQKKEEFFKEKIEDNLSEIIDMKSSTGAIDQFQENLPLIKSILIDGNATYLYKNSGTDVFVEMAYLCHILDSSKDIAELKQEMKTATGLLLISGDEVFGGKENVTEYNKVITDFIENKEQKYNIFYKELQIAAKAISVSNASRYVKDLAKVVMSIYGAGEQKYVYNKPIDCRNILTENFPLLQQKK